MTPGPSALGTLLIQRLDAVLGTTLAQHAHLMTSARARAVAQTAPTARTRGYASLTDPRQPIEPIQHANSRPAAHGTSRAVLHDVGHPRIHGTPDGRHRGDGLGTDATHTTHTRLSHAARLILTLLTQYPERAPAVTGQQPLWSLATGLTENLARTLAHTVATSGLFYESHLLDLAHGVRTPAQLAVEPQARFTIATMPDAALLPQAMLLIRQQLDVLAYQTFCWQGLAWPGATLAWQIQRNDRAENQPEAHANEMWRTPWCTRLRLTLSGLGAIDAQLTLTGNALALSIVAPDCAALLQRHLPALCSRYRDCGLIVTQQYIDERPNTGDTP